MTEKTQLYRWYVNSQGYDSSGTYWGIGAPLYVAITPDGIYSYVRAWDRESAKEQIVREHYNQKLTFYR